MYNVSYERKFFEVLNKIKVIKYDDADERNLWKK